MSPKTFTRTLVLDGEEAMALDEALENELTVRVQVNVSFRDEATGTRYSATRIIPMRLKRER